MGNCNCLFIDNKPIRIMKTDGKILEYKSPTRVFQVLSDFSGHEISDAVPVSHHLHRTAKLLSGHLYFLIPKEPEEKKPKKAVRFAEPEKETATGGGVVRIKVVMTKKELQEMVERGGISAEEMICKIKNGCGEISSRSEMEEEEDDDDDDEESELQRWKPVLESIPESEVAC
ncbi:uncharacterized protein LOC101213283 [Cucumis sativus]|uniref:DUF4228 domain-containing protein n=1 Tax=Cucumis sativus TaxID=3659 RepID=A0A0A0KHH5_CUCSA|nr:uncharacterized protein LOC101213283 [Cucumis sativus]KGN48264.1 hypothetical protein Csa_003716 [Cucumis sativus]